MMTDVENRLWQLADAVTPKRWKPFLSWHTNTFAILDMKDEEVIGWHGFDSSRAVTNKRAQGRLAAFIGAADPSTIKKLVEENRRLRALAALTPQPDTGLRERVARLIEPGTFKVADRMWEHCRRSGDSPEFTFRCVVDSYGDRISVAYEKADAILAMLPGGTGCPDGWVMVPRAPTPAMKEAGAAFLRPVVGGSYDLAHETYAAMLSALPEGEK